MTNPNAALISVILDRSGSMKRIRSDTIGSFNTFLEEQKKLPVDVRFGLTLFDTEIEIMYDGVPIAEVEPLTEDTYAPDGNTALYDAIGWTVSRVGERLLGMREDKRPGRVVVAILTDGEENSSRMFRLDKINQIIKTQREQFSWQFMFLGADLSAVEVATSMGIAASNAMAYGATPKGMQTVLRSMSASIGSYAGGQSLDASFTDQDRAENAPQP